MAWVTRRTIKTTTSSVLLTPVAKFELYSPFFDAPARDTSENDPPGGSGFGGIAIACNVKNKEDAGSVIELVKKAGTPSSRSPKIRFGRISRVFCRSGRILPGGGLGARF